MASPQPTPSQRSSLPPSGPQQKSPADTQPKSAVLQRDVSSFEPASKSAPAGVSAAQTAKPALSVKGKIVAGGELSANNVRDVNKAAEGQRSKRFIAYQDQIKVGGSLAWRANNPGNLRGASTEIGKVDGAVGSFAVFPNMEAGRQAQRALYLSDKYADGTVKAAVEKLTPSSENNTTRYLKELENSGIDLKGTVRSQIDPLMQAIERNEGMLAGVVVNRRP